MTGWGLPRMFIENSVNIETEECILWPFKTRGGYAIIRNIDRWISVPPMVLEAKGFSRPSLLHEAAHSCRNRNCINHKHLSWKTHQENMMDTFRDGTASCQYRDSKHPRRILTNDQVHWIRHQIALGFPLRKIADQLKISLAAIKGISCGKNWNWLPVQDPYVRFWNDLL